MCRKIAKLLCYLVIFSYSISTGLAEWTRLGEDKEGTAIYIDQSTLQRKDDIATLWVLFDYRANQLVDGVSSRSAIAKLRYDCFGEKLRILSTSFHSGNMGLGKVISSNSVPKRWEPISPNSMAGSSFDYACSLFSTEGVKHKYSQEIIPLWKQGPSTELADVFFDPKSLKRSKNKASTIVIINFKTPTNTGSKLAWSAKSRVEFECRKKMSRYSKPIYFDLPYGKGERIMDEFPYQNVWKSIAEDGLSNGMFDIACTRH